MEETPAAEATDTPTATSQRLPLTTAASAVSPAPLPTCTPYPTYTPQPTYTALVSATSTLSPTRTAPATISKTPTATLTATPTVFVGRWREGHQRGGGGDFRTRPPPGRQGNGPPAPFFGYSAAAMAAADARTLCRRSVTGGRVLFVEYQDANAFDANLVCP